MSYASINALAIFQIISMLYELAIFGLIFGFPAFLFTVWPIICSFFSWIALIKWKDRKPRYIKVACKLVAVMETISIFLHFAVLGFLIYYVDKGNEFNEYRLLASYVVIGLSVLTKIFIVVMAGIASRGRWQHRTSAGVPECHACDDAEDEDASSELCGLFCLICLGCCRLAAEIST